MFPTDRRALLTHSDLKKRIPQWSQVACPPKIRGTNNLKGFDPMPLEYQYVVFCDIIRDNTIN